MKVSVCMFMYGYRFTSITVTLQVRQESVEEAKPKGNSYLSSAAAQAVLEYGFEKSEVIQAVKIMKRLKGKNL